MSYKNGSVTMPMPTGSTYVNHAQGIQWEHVTFNPRASVTRKLVEYVTLGLLKYAHPKPILHNVYGNLKLGELVGLLGPSGAGKSSLMKCLTEGFCYSGFSGKIWSYGIPEKIRASIIHQDEKEHLILDLTVKETLMYASELKNRSWCLPADFHEENVTELMITLGLDNKANTLVSKCSGGERKRLAIGVELSEKKKPHILFLDEPTTGLDSSVAFTVIKALHIVAKKNQMSVVTTIHQPSVEILNVFNKAIILSGTGAVIYHDNPSQVRLERFLTVSLPPGDSPFRCFQNPADVMIGLASALKRGKSSIKKFKKNEKDSGDYHRKSSRCCCTGRFCLPLTCSEYTGAKTEDDEGGEESEKDASPFLEESLFESEAAKMICKNMIDLTASNFRNVEGRNDVTKENYSFRGILCRANCSIGSFIGLHGFWTLLKRTWKLRIVLGRNSLLLRLLIYMLVVGITTRFYQRDIGKASGCIPLKGPSSPFVVDPKNCECYQTAEDIRRESKVSSNIKLIFFFLLFLSLESLLNVALTFPREFKLFQNEFQNGWYSAPSYFFSKLLVEIPAQLIIPTAYSIYFYVYTQQEDFGVIWDLGPLAANWTQLDMEKGERFKIYLRATYLTGFIAQGLGFLIGILCVKSVSKTILVSSGTLLGLSFLSGFFKKRIQLNEAGQWLTQFSFLRYGLETKLISIYGRGRCEPPNESYAMVAFGIKDEELEDNWIGFFRLMLFTWLVTFFVLEMKASKWFLCKLVSHLSLAFLASLENCVSALNEVFHCCQLCFGVKDVLEKPFSKVWMCMGCVCKGVGYLVTFVIFPIALYICIADFIGVWK